MGANTIISGMFSRMADALGLPGRMHKYDEVIAQKPPRE